jgi:hypothetical protein
VRLLTWIVGLPDAQLRVGMPLRVTFREAGGHGLIAVFEPAGSAANS